MHCHFHVTLTAHSTSPLWATRYRYIYFCDTWVQVPHSWKLYHHLHKGISPIPVYYLSRLGLHFGGHLPGSHGILGRRREGWGCLGGVFLQFSCTTCSVIPTILHSTFCHSLCTGFLSGSWMGGRVPACLPAWVCHLPGCSFWDGLSQVILGISVQISYWVISCSGMHIFWAFPFSPPAPPHHQVMPQGHHHHHFSHVTTRYHHPAYLPLPHLPFHHFWVFWDSATWGLTLPGRPFHSGSWGYLPHSGCAILPHCLPLPLHLGYLPDLGPDFLTVLGAPGTDT